MSAPIEFVSRLLERMPVVRRFALDGMLSLENSIRNELAGVLVGQAVEHSRALASGRHDAPKSKLREVLGDGRLKLMNRVGELNHGQLRVAEGQNDANTRSVSEHREDLDGQVSVLPINIQRLHLLIFIYALITA